MKINREALYNQTKEEILESGSYFRIELIVPGIKNLKDAKNGIMPITQVESHNTNIFTDFAALKCVESIAEKIREETPELILMEKIFKHTTQEIEGDEFDE